MRDYNSKKPAHPSRSPQKSPHKNNAPKTGGKGSSAKKNGRGGGRKKDSGSLVLEDTKKLGEQLGREGAGHRQADHDDAIAAQKAKLGNFFGLCHKSSFD